MKRLNLRLYSDLWSTQKHSKVKSKMVLCNIACWYWGACTIFCFKVSSYSGCLFKSFSFSFFQAILLLLLLAKIGHLKIKEQLLGKILLYKKMSKRKTVKQIAFFQRFPRFHHFPNFSSGCRVSSLSQLFIRLSSFITFQTFHQVVDFHHFPNFSSGCRLSSLSELFIGFFDFIVFQTLHQVVDFQHAVILRKLKISFT